MIISNEKTDNMVEKIYCLMEEEGLSVNEAWSVVFELKIKLDHSKDLIANKMLREARKYKGDVITKQV